MIIETLFSPGDMVWVIMDGKPMPGTVGQVRVCMTDSMGINGGCIEPLAPHIAFDNYKPQKSRVEEYMIDETGVGSGNVYTLGKDLFKSQDECLAAIEATTT